MATGYAALLCALSGAAATWVLSDRLGRLLATTVTWLRLRPQVYLAALGSAMVPWWSATVLEMVLLTGTVAGLALLVVADLAVHRLPDALVLATGAWVLAWQIILAAAGSEWTSLGRALLAGCLIGLVFTLLCVLTPSGIGLGDAKLSAVLGMLLGWFGWPQVLLGVLFAFLLGGVFAVVLLATRRASRSTAVAFGPWLVAGAAGALTFPGMLL